MAPKIVIPASPAAGHRKASLGSTGSASGFLRSPAVQNPALLSPAAPGKLLPGSANYRRTGSSSATPSWGRTVTSSAEASSYQDSAQGPRSPFAARIRSAKVFHYDSSDSSSSDEPPLVEAEAYANPWYQQLRDGTCRRRFHACAKKHRQLAKGHGQHPFPRVRQCVRSTGFETWLTTVIVLNCIYVGWQADLPAEDAKPQGVKNFETILQHVFNVCFILELVSRVLCEGWTYVFLRDNHLDVFLVLLSIMLATLQLISAVSGAEIKGAQTLRKLTVLRTLRLVKLAKAVRRRPEFREMWSLLRGIYDSFKTLFWTYVLIFCVLYFFGIMATVLIAGSASFQGTDEASQVAQDMFGDVNTAMVTLFQVMTLDSWTAIMRPLMQVQPWVSIFFMLFISVAVFLLMNLITAVIVENAFKSAQEDEVQVAMQQEAEKERELETLLQFFKDLDFDGDDVITPEELDQAKKDPSFRAALRVFGLSLEDLDALFDLLDADQSGYLECEEFVMGIRRLKGEPKAKDLLVLSQSCKQVDKYLDEAERTCAASEQRVQRMSAQMKTYEQDLEKLHKTLLNLRQVILYAQKTQKQPSPPPSPRTLAKRRRVARVAADEPSYSEGRRTSRHSVKSSASSAVSCEDPMSGSASMASGLASPTHSPRQLAVPSVSVHMVAAGSRPDGALLRRSTASSESIGSQCSQGPPQCAADLRTAGGGEVPRSTSRNSNLRVSFRVDGQILDVGKPVSTLE